MISCIAVDDEPWALKQIVGYIEKVPYLNLLGSFTEVFEALDFIQGNIIDLIFVDINMPDLTGIDFVKSLSDPPKVIFTTAYREYAFEGFKVDAADYLVKPISYSNFFKSVEKTRLRYFNKDIKVENIVRINERFLFVKSEYKVIRIDFDDVKYIEGMRDYIRIHLENQSPVMILMGMKKVQEVLPEDEFMRVHRSYLVNLKKIRTVERTRIVFDENVFIPIGDVYKEQFQNFLNNNFLK